MCKEKYSVHKLRLPKIKRIKHFGKGNTCLELYGNNFNSCLEHAQEYSQNSGGIFVPFNDIDIIEGQGTVARKLWKKWTILTFLLDV